jgi:Tfp pilus assembly protein PilX
MSAMQTTRPSIRKSERGMISLMTTMVLMIIISLIVLGFAQMTRRNQRASLDRQQSAQAFYAAESGVNDARNLIEAAVNAGNVVPAKTSCSDLGNGGFYASLNSNLDAARGISYSCLTVDPSPTTLRYSDIGTTSTIVPITSATGSNFSTIKISLQSKISSGNPITGCPSTTLNVFSPTGSWACGYGVLRFDLVPTAGGGLTADSLRTSTMTTFAVPMSVGGTASIPYVANTANTNNLVGMQCTAIGCVLTITGLSQSSYGLRITSLYQDMAMQISSTDSGGGAIEMTGAQAVIDSTGKSQDVLRRIQVNVPFLASSKNQLSDYALQTNDAVCKRYSVMSGYFLNDPLVTSTVTSNNRLCN